MRKEELTISADPYVNAGGNFGTRLKLNEVAFASLAQASDFERDIVISRRRKKETESPSSLGDTLVMRGVEMPKISFKRRTLHDLQITNQSFDIQVDDAKLVELADKKTAEIYRSGENMDGHNILFDQFLRIFNNEVRSGLRSALRHEKIGFSDHKSGYYNVGLLSFALSDVALRGSLNLGHGLVIMSTLATKVLDETYISEGLKTQLSPVRLIKGNYQLLKHGRELIIENQSKEE